MTRIGRIGACHPVWACVLAMLLVSVIAGMAQAADGVARAVKVRGEVMVTRAGADQPVAEGTAFQRRDIVKTGAKARLQIGFADGSIVTLNTNSRVAVRYTKALRRIALSQGEALFDVAKNRRRPFIVEAHDTQVRAVGTSFTVKLLPQQIVQVLVREGVIEIKRPDVPEAPPVRLAANNVALAPARAPISTATPSSSSTIRAAPPRPISARPSSSFPPGKPR